MVLEDIEQKGGGKQEIVGEIVIDVTSSSTIRNKRN